VRMRVVVPLLLALAAALGLVLGAVLPTGDQPAAGSPSASSTNSNASQNSTQPSESSSDANPSQEPSSNPNVDFTVTGEGGGVAAENQPQPAFNATKLALGEKPPQFVVVSFDGACSSDVFNQFMDTAEATGAHYTLFLSGLCLLPESQRFLYATPGRDAGSSAIGFADDTPEVSQRITNLTRAYNSGHEIGTHFLGHWCEPSQGSVNSWNAKEWQSEFAQDAQFMNDWASINGITDPTPLPFNHSIVQGARTPCLEGQRDVMYPIFKANGFKYDASNSGTLEWPIMNEYGLWDFPLQGIQVSGFGRNSLSMDYNLMCQQNGSGGQNCSDSSDPVVCEQARQSTYDSLMAATDAVYNGNRAPLFWGMHWKALMCGAYISAVNQFIRDAVAQYPDLQFISNKDLVTWLEVQDPSVLAKLRAQGAQSY
jgi:hypothetical protein